MFMQGQWRYRIALKVEDGSKRAKHAVSLHILKQLEWIELRIQDIEEKVFNYSEGVRIEVKGQLKFKNPKEIEK